MLRFAFVVVFTLTTALLLAPSSSVAFDLFATHEVTVQFATQDGKPLANAEVQVFPLGTVKLLRSPGAPMLKENLFSQPTKTASGAPRRRAPIRSRG